MLKGNRITLAFLAWLGVVERHYRSYYPTPYLISIPRLSLVVVLLTQLVYATVFALTCGWAAYDWVAPVAVGGVVLLVGVADLVLFWDYPVGGTCLAVAATYGGYLTYHLWWGLTPFVAPWSGLLGLVVLLVALAAYVLAVAATSMWVETMLKGPAEDWFDAMVYVQLMVPAEVLLCSWGIRSWFG